MQITLNLDEALLKEAFKLTRYARKDKGNKDKGQKGKV